MKMAKVLWGATDLGAPHFSSDLLWRTDFRVPDPLFLVEIGGRTTLFASPLEAGRAAKEAAADCVVRIIGNGLDAVTAFLKKRGILQITIPGDFPHASAEKLKKNFSIAIGREPWYPERARKSAGEVREIEKAQRAAERAFDAAIIFLRACAIKGKLLYHGDRPATSEMTRKLIDDALWREGYLATDTIVASGAQAADPHCIGSGPLRSRAPIVIDIFPVSLRTHYYADMTRTVFKGEPTHDYIKMYEAVRIAQERAIKKIRPGADGKMIYKSVHKYFAAQEYPTHMDAKKSEGFIHGLGHGVGIDIHEHPRLGSAREILEEGNVVTIEPGLYYPRARRGIPAGGIRIEDMMLVTKTGCHNMTQCPKGLQSAVVP